LLSEVLSQQNLPVFIGWDSCYGLTEKYSSNNELDQSLLSIEMITFTAGNKIRQFKNKVVSP
jgi:hypothetical protein